MKHWTIVWIILAGVTWATEPEARAQIVPNGMTAGDVGSSNVTGSSGYVATKETWIVTRTGADVGGTADQFQFLRYTTAGDGDILAQLNEQQNASGEANAGVMARSSSDVGAVYAAVLHSGNNTITFQYRAEPNGVIHSDSVAELKLPVYLKVSHSGGMWTGYYSTDGKKYIVIGQPVTIANLGKDKYDAGLVSTSGQAVFRGFSAPLNLIAHGKVNYTIQLADDTNKVLNVAATELAEYLARIGGGEAPAITNETQKGAPTGPCIILGDQSAMAKSLASKLDYNGISAQGFIIKTVGPNIIIANANPGGTQYGVFWFLDRVLGVHWLDVKFTQVPSRPDLTIDVVNERQTPRFEFRQVLDTIGQNADMAWHNLLNGRAFGAAGDKTPDGSANWDKSWAWDYYNGSFSGQVPPPAPRLGFSAKGVSGGMQITMMEEFTRQKMAEAIVKDIQHRDQHILDHNYYTVFQNDNGWSADKASWTFAKEHGGTLAAPLLDMMIDVQKRVRNTKNPKLDFSKVKLAFQAYQWGFTPPKNMIVPDGMMVIPYDIHLDQSSDFEHDLKHGGYNQKLAEDMVQWNAITKDKIQFFDHTTNFQNFAIPTPNNYPIAKNIRWLAGLDKVWGYEAEGDHWNWKGNASDFAALKVWLTARMLWDPNVTDDQISDMIAMWCNGYYGSAAGPFIKQYIDLTQQWSDKTGSPSWEKDGIENTMYTIDYVKAADELFDKATAAAANDPAYLAHVNVARISLDNLILQRRAEYVYKYPQFNIDYDNRLARLKASVESRQIKMAGQGMPIDDIFAIAEVNRKYPAAVPQIVEHTPPGGWGQVQEFDLFRWGMSKNIVEDPEASDGVAMKLNSKWAPAKVIFKLENLPNDGVPYRMWVAVRAEIADGTPPNTQVLKMFEEFAPGNQQTYVTAAHLADGKYHYIEILHGPHEYRNSDMASISFKAINNDKIKAVYLDRLIYARATSSKK